MLSISKPGKELLWIVTSTSIAGLLFWNLRWHAIEILTMLGEWGIVFVIYRELKGAREQLKEAEAAREAGILSQLLNDLASKEMIEAERALRRWQEDHPNDFAQQYEQLFRARNTKGDEIDNHRQFVFRYYYLVKHFCETVMIREELLYDPLFCNSTSHKIVLDILEPLQKVYEEVVLNPPYDVRLFNYYRRKFKMPAHMLGDMKCNDEPFSIWRPPAAN